MRLWLEFHPDMAVLHILDGGHRMEVRGHPGVGSKFVGDRLDRILAALPDRVNVSLLFADQVATCWGEDKEVVREALRKEDEMARLLMTSKIEPRGPVRPGPRPTHRERRGIRMMAGHSPVANAQA